MSEEIGVIETVLSEVRQFRDEVNSRFGEVKNDITDLRSDLRLHRKTGNGRQEPTTTEVKLNFKKLSLASIGTLILGVAGWFGKQFFQ